MWCEITGFFAVSQYIFEELPILRQIEAEQLWPLPVDWRNPIGQRSWDQKIFLGGHEECRGGWRPDLRPEWPRGRIFLSQLGWFQLFPDSQDHLGEVQMPKTARSRLWARTTLGIDFWAKLLKQKLFGMFRWVDFNFFRTARTIWVRSRHQRLPGVGREQGQPKELISGQSCFSKSCWEWKTGLV